MHFQWRYFVRAGHVHKDNSNECHCEWEWSLIMHRIRENLNKKRCLHDDCIHLTSSHSNMKTFPFVSEKISEERSMILLTGQVVVLVFLSLFFYKNKFFSLVDFYAKSSLYNHHKIIIIWYFSILYCKHFNLGLSRSSLCFRPLKRFQSRDVFRPINSMTFEYFKENLSKPISSLKF